MKIGILGGGQLAQMLALAAYPLNLQVVCLEQAADCPAGKVTKVITGDAQQPACLDELAQQVDVITYESENFSSSSLQYLAQQLPVYPSLSALEISQDRWLEKNFFQKNSVPTTQFYKIDSLVELKNAIHNVGLPLILKTRRFGYDGKGQIIIRNLAEVETAWQSLQQHALIVENVIKFDREVSLIGVRSRQGEIKFYPLVENIHKEGILAITLAPFCHESLTTKAQEYVKRILLALDYVGVLAVEFFQKGEELIANEMAPRVHNSGHWTIEGAYTSQFENHLRAIAGLPLGATEAIANCAMFNLVGNTPPLTEILAISTAHCHLYGKTPRPKRKLGHITLCTNDNNIFTEQFERLKKLIF